MQLFLFSCLVLKQRFNPQVYDEFVVRGNTAVLKCHLPPFVKEYVVVDSWIRNDDHIMKMTENKGKVLFFVMLINIIY